MKKLKLILCICVMTSLLTGCSGQNTRETEMSSSAESAALSSTETTQDNPSQPQTTANNQENTMISVEEAKNIALSHAGLNANQVNFIQNNLDVDDGRRNYDIEFYTKDGREYDYEIDPYSGKILVHDFDAEHYIQSSAIPETTENREITADTATKIALAKVPGATEQDIKEFKTDYDDGRLHYEGTIYFGQMKYEFEIDGETGEICEWDEESIYD